MRKVLLVCLMSCAGMQAMFSDSDEKLIRAVQQDNISDVQQLLGYGADITAEDFFGWGVLHTCVHYNGSLELMKILLGYGANINKLSKDGSSPLHLAVKQDNFSMVRVLIENGADYTITNKNNETALNLAHKRDPTNHDITNFLCTKLSYDYIRNMPPPEKQYFDYFYE